MADNKVNSEEKPKKRRFYHNLKDSYAVGRRTYKHLPWYMLGAFLATVAVFGLIGFAINHLYYMLFLGVLTSILVTLSTMSFFVRKAMYKQIDGHVGAVSAVLSQVRRGWIVEERPVAYSRNQDVVWRIVGKKGIVLITEGKPSAVARMLEDEAKKCRRIVPNVQIHFIQVGHEDGQVPLEKLLSSLRKLKASTKLTTQEVPAVAKRLIALQASKGLPIPKGIDPMRIKNARNTIR